MTFIGYDIIEPHGLVEKLKIKNVVKVEVSDEIHIVHENKNMELKEYFYKTDSFVKIEIL